MSSLISFFWNRRLLSATKHLNFEELMTDLMDSYKFIYHGNKSESTMIPKFNFAIILNMTTPYNSLYSHYQIDGLVRGAFR